MQSEPRGTVELWMPASAAYLLLARLEAAALGGLLEQTVDEIDDLRLAVEELCLWVLRRPRAMRGRLCLAFDWDDSQLEATCTLVDDDVPLGEDALESDELTDGLSMQILAALTDEHGVTSEGGQHRGWLRKKRPGA